MIRLKLAHSNGFYTLTIDEDPGRPLKTTMCDFRIRKTYFKTSFRDFPNKTASALK